MSEAPKYLIMNWDAADSTAGVLGEGYTPEEAVRAFHFWNNQAGENPILYVGIGPAALSKPLSNAPAPDSQGTQKQHPPMVEAVARALCRADGPDPNEPNWEDKYWIAYTGAAWNVIKAIRLPTDPMLERGNEELASGAYGVWRAMFDAVLVN